MKKPFQYKAFTRNVSKRFIFFTIFLTLLFFNYKVAFAYDNDTHFWLTYYLAVKSGYTSLQATQIASATVSVDFDKNSQPLIPRAISLSDLSDPVQNVRARLHALPLRSEINKFRQSSLDWKQECETETDESIQKHMAVSVQKGQDLLWEEVTKNKDNPGVFFHYLQDKYAHQNFRSYWGHACYSRIDFTDSDPDKAEDMAMETVRYLREFMKLRWADRPLPPEPDENEIKTFLARLNAENKSDGVVPSPLLTAMKNSTLTNLKTFFLLNWKKTYNTFNDRPDSSKARVLVAEALNLSEKDIPNIWLYDLDKYGKPEKSKTSETACYKKFSIERLDETDNLKKGDKCKKNQYVRCVPWRVVEFNEIETSCR